YCVLDETPSAISRRRPDKGEDHAYMAGICKNLKCSALIIGGVEDHVHMLNRHSKNLSVADFLRDLKRPSSKWIKTLNPTLVSFNWQAGYGAFSISPSHVAEVRNYIANQAEHHRHESFQDEFRRLCRKYGVEIDERYAWD
ncbi:MAG: transposase, partial [bacterium]